MDKIFDEAEPMPPLSGHSMTGRVSDSVTRHTRPQMLGYAIAYPAYK